MTDASAPPASGQTVDLPAHPSSAGAARRFVAAHLERGGLGAVADNVQLLVSELVTNSLLHGRTTMRLEIRYDSTTVSVAVHDDCPVLGARRPFVSEGTTGRGLVLVEALADEWGSDRTDWGKVTWFTVRVEKSAVASDGP